MFTRSHSHPFHTDPCLFTSYCPFLIALFSCPPVPRHAPFAHSHNTNFLSTNCHSSPYPFPVHQFPVVPHLPILITPISCPPTATPRHTHFLINHPTPYSFAIRLFFITAGATSTERGLAGYFCGHIRSSVVTEGDQDTPTLVATAVH